MSGVLAAVSTGRAILIGVAAGITVVAVIGAVALGLRPPRRVGGPDIPPAMRAAPSDQDLEVPVREKLYAWGMILVVIMAIWVPVVFLRENVTNKSDTIALDQQSVLRGMLTTKPGTEVNQIGFNCERCHGTDLHGGQNVYNGNVVPVPNLQTVCGGAATGHPLIKGLQDIVDTIAEGRTGTDMPSWSVRFAGAMDDQQIQDLVNYILSIQKVPPSQNICIKPPSAATTRSPSPSASASPSASSSP
jgi:cytochrome c553